MNGNGFVGIFLLIGGIVIGGMATSAAFTSADSDKIQAVVTHVEPSDGNFNKTTFRYTDHDGTEKEDSFLTDKKEEIYFEGHEVTIRLTKNGIAPESRSDIGIYAALGAVGLALIIGGGYIFVHRDTIVLPSSDDD